IRFSRGNDRLATEREGCTGANRARAVGEPTQGPDSRRVVSRPPKAARTPGQRTTLQSANAFATRIRDRLPRSVRNKIEAKTWTKGDRVKDRTAPRDSWSTEVRATQSSHAKITGEPILPRQR